MRLPIELQIALAVYFGADPERRAVFMRALRRRIIHLRFMRKVLARRLQQ